MRVYEVGLARWLFGVTLVCAFLLYYSGPAQASSLIPVNLEEITVRAGTIFAVQVLSRSDAFLVSGLSATTYTVKVLEVAKGTAVVGQNYTIRQLGLLPGTNHSGRVFSIPGMPVYEVGGAYALFLMPVSVLGLTSPVGLGQGVFDITDQVGSGGTNNAIPAGIHSSVAPPQYQALSPFDNNTLFVNLSRLPQLALTAAERAAIEQRSGPISLDVLFSLVAKLTGRPAPDTIDLKLNTSSAYPMAAGFGQRAGGQAKPHFGHLRFDPSTGLPSVWDIATDINPGGTLPGMPWNPDQGMLGILDNATAISVAAAGFDVWTAVTTSAATSVQGAPMSVDCTAINTATCLTTAPDGLSPIIFDVDGSILTALGNDPCSVIGFSGITFIDPSNKITEMVILMNGLFIDGSPNTTECGAGANKERTQAEFKGIFAHEIGHSFNLDHTQVNENEILTGGNAGGFGTPPLSSVLTLAPFSISGADPLTLELDDRVSISALYPTGGFLTTTISGIGGTIFNTDGTTPFNCANVIARDQADPFFTAVSNVSGDLGSLVGGSTSFDGDYAIPGLPAGRTYRVELDLINPSFTGGSGVGPCDPPVTFGSSPEEFYNAGNESSDPAVDDPTASVGVTVNSFVSGIDIILNAAGGTSLADLTAVKTNDLGGSNAVVGTPFNWTITVTNTGSLDATFLEAPFQRIVDDDLPSGATYGTPTIQNGIGITGGPLGCTLSGNFLFCGTTLGSGSATVAATTGSFQVVIPVTPTVDGTLVNPDVNGVCRADPQGVIVENDEGNNDCTDIVTVGTPTQPDLTAVKTNDLGGGNATVGVPFNWTIVVANNGAGTANFADAQIVLDDWAPFGPTYGNATVTPSGGATGTVTCTLFSNPVIECVASGPVTLPVGGSFSISFPVTPNSTVQLINPTPLNATCLADPNNVVAESIEGNNDCANTVNVDAAAQPDLTANKPSISIIPVDLTVISIITVSNSGSATGAANFTTGQEIFRDDFPSNVSLTNPSATNLTGVTGTINCSVASSRLTCTAGNAVTMNIGGSFGVQFTVTGTAVGTLTNPAPSGNCQVDFFSVITESNEGNNTCSASYTVPGMDLTATKSNDTSGAGTVGVAFNWKVTLANAASNVGGRFTAGQTIFTDNLPTGPTYGTPSISTPVNITTTNVSCSIVSNTLTCTASGGNVDFGTSSSFDVTFSVTPNAATTLSNPSGGVCKIDPLSVEPESNESNNACSDSVTVSAAPQPDLTATKANNTSGNGVIGTSFNWTVTVANTGAAAATFTTGQKIFQDDLPSSGATYGSATVQNQVGITGTIACSVASNTLTCTASGSVTMALSTGSFDVVFSATPTATGSLSNPRSAGVCKADPNTLITESNEGNNTCSDSVTVSAAPQPDLTATKANNTSGNGVVGTPFNWTVTVANTGAAAATFTTGQKIFQDDLPSSGATYGSATVQNQVGITGTIACSVASNALTCTASGSVTMALSTGHFDVVFSATPTATGSLANPGSAGVCKADPDALITESNEGNNTCSDSVTVSAAPQPEIDVQRPASTSIADGGTDGVGNHVVGTAFTLTYTVANTGAGTLTLGTNAVSLGTSSNSTATVTAQPATSVAPAGTTTFTVQVTPSASGAFSVPVVLSNDDANENPYNITISGTGTVALLVTLQASPQSITANGTSTSNVTATVTLNGVAQSSATVTFSKDTNVSATLITSLTPTTNAQGKASVTVQSSTTVEAADVNASVTVLGTTATATIAIFMNESGGVSTGNIDQIAFGSGGGTQTSGTPKINTISVTSTSGTTVTTATFNTNPATLPPPSGITNFLDVHLSSIAGVSQVVIEFCPAGNPPGVLFWNGSAWVVASIQTASGGCVTVTVNATSVPNLTQLSGQFFGTGGGSTGGGTTGGDPPIWGNLMAFPTPEYAIGQDLNGDGDTLDTVLRYQKLDTGQIVNTELQVSNRYRDVDLYEHTIAFMEQSPYPVGMIWLYDTDTGKAQQTGVIGFHPTIYGHLLTASSDTVRYLDLDTNTFVDTGLPGTWLSVWGDIIAYQRQVQKGSAPDIRYYNVKTKEVVNTHAAGWAPAIYENIITFATVESEIKQDLNGDGDTNDIVVRYYDINTQQTYNTGQVGNYVSIYGNRIVYSNHNEVYYYDIDQKQAFNTHRLGTEPDIYEGTISYYLWEKWATQDLNTDGDRQDPIVRTYKVSDLDVATPSRSKAPILTIEPLSISALLGYPNPVHLGQEVAFEVEGTGIKDISVAVFDLAGQRVYESGFVPGNTLGWNVLNDEGQAVANGVYLYVVTARGFDKRVILSRVKKLVVLR